MKDPRYSKWLFEQHSYETIRHWARSLRNFRFCRAYGGHANDGDSFRCSLLFQGEDGLLRLCRSLLIQLATLPLDTPRPKAGQPYSWADYQKFRHPIEAFPHFEQPGHIQVLSVPAFAWIGRETVDLHLSGADGDSYAVTNADFQNAKRLDEEFNRLGVRFRDPPVEGPLCVCPDHWPEVFADDGPQDDHRSKPTHA